MKSKIIIGAIVLVLFIGGYFFIDSLLFDGIKPVSVNENGIQASFFAQKDIIKQPAVVLIGGGQWGDYWGQEIAKANYVGLSLPYTRLEGLPSLPEEIPLEYFEKAIDWLKEQSQVNPDKIIVMGASRNAELALVTASNFPERIHGVIAYCPSSVSWSNTVLPFNSDQLKPSWTFRDNPVPFITMEKLKGPSSDTVRTLSYWRQGLSDSLAVQKAFIPVEKINGPVLLLSGLEDEVWPAAMMSDMLEERINNNAFKYEFENIQYENAGHLLSGSPSHPPTMRQGNMMIDGKSYTYNFGGTLEGDIAAQQDASRRVFDFLAKLNGK